MAPTSPIITFTTDFGTEDSFVGTMKGIVLAINPDATMVDLTHEVPPQDIAAGAFQLGTAYPYFPHGTIHVAVVDPGVGTGRRPILITGPHASFVCPDNGLPSYCFLQAGFPSPECPPFTSSPVTLPSGWQAFHLTNQQYWHRPVSSTFHGRDVFAPAAAYLSRGVPPENMGVAISTVTALAIPQPTEHQGKLLGCVLSVDRFGNLITNIPASALLMPDANIVIDAGQHRVSGLTASYQQGAPLLAIVGSHGYLEVAASNRSAAQMLGLKVGDPVTVGLA